jgi:NAD(P)-dependent dehydrogenase (short-subunit alcohol dehydrogenase family)
MAPLALVTGASTGIGRACATHLAALGFEVLAGVRRPADAPPGLEAVRLDVTRAEDIAAAAERVGTHLHALVNNAGIAISGPLEGVPVSEWRRQMEVNLLGQVAVTQAVLPAVIRARGRVVNMSSIGGRNALPLFGPYSASKFALEAMTDSLRREVAPLGVKVVSVEPGGIATPIWDKGIADADRLVDAMPEDVRRRYDGVIAVMRRQSERVGREGLPPGAVAAVVGRALTARRPHTRYLVGRDAKAQAALGRLLPGRAFDALLRLALTSGGRSGGRG